MNIFGFEISRSPAPIYSKSAKHVGGKRARITQDEPNTNFLGSLLNQPTTLTDWHTGDFDAATLSTFDTAQLLEMMTDISPEISKAVWDFLLFCNPGWEAVALRPNDDEQDDRATAILNEMISQLDDYYGTTNVVINRLFMATLLRGAMLAELVLDDAGREFVDLATPDPIYIRFRKIADPLRGEVWQLGQYQSGVFVPLESELIRYIPLHPLPGKPYGRAPIAPALFGALFLLSMLNDLKRVIQQQGYPRINVAINTERLMTTMPPDVVAGSQEFVDWIQAAVNEVATAYASLEPEDAYVHLDTIEINRPVGTLGFGETGGLQSVDGLISAIERVVIRGVKSIPLLFGNNETTTETHANRQWEIHVAGIKSVQHLAETLLGRLFTIALQAQGVQATVKWTFAELRASEELRDAQTETLKIQNAKAKFEAGWISQDEASEEVTGSPADQEEPRQAAGGFPPQFIQDNNDGEMRQRGRRLFEPGPVGPLDPEPEELEITEDDLDRAVSLWDRLMPDYAGLLDGRNGWTFDQGEKIYRNTETGETLNEDALRDLAQVFQEKQRSRKPRQTRQVGALTDRLISGDLNVETWLTEMRQEIKDAFVTQYVQARGGRDLMTPADFGRIGRMLAPDGQYSRLQRFAEQIALGQLSEAQIRLRASMYIDAAGQAFEAGRAAAFGVRLPEYPRDGNQICLTNCKCRWLIIEFGDRWECSWILDEAEHCESCLGNAARWNPLTISKDEAADRAALVQTLNGGKYAGA